MDYAEKLREAIGEKSFCRKVTEDRLKVLTDKFSEDFINLWKNDGFCCYGNGKFWTVDPELVTSIIPELELIPEGFSVIGRDAFANVYLLSNDEIYRLDVHYNEINNISMSTDFFFDFELYSKGFNKKFLEEKKFNSARKLLGDLEADECYSYKLALSLGGDDDVTNMKKVKFLEQLSLLVQLNVE